MDQGGPKKRRRHTLADDREEKEEEERQQNIFEELDARGAPSPIHAPPPRKSESRDPENTADAFAHVGSSLSRALQPLTPALPETPHVLEALRTIERQEKEIKRLREQLEKTRTSPSSAGEVALLRMEPKQARDQARATEELLKQKEWEWAKFRLEMESEANKKEWQLRREKEKADILLRPSAGRFSLSSPLATTPVEVKELKATNETLEKRVSDLEKEKLLLNEQLAEEQLKSKNAQTQLENKIYRMTQAEVTLRAENETLAKQNELLTRQLGQVHEEAETVIRLRSELAKAEERIQVLSNASEFNGEAASLVEAMQEELGRMVEVEKRCKAFETENTKLRQRMQNSQILQDEIERLQAKYNRARKDLESHSLLQVEYENLLKQIAKWESHFGNLSQFESPAHIAKVVEDLQRKNENLNEKCGQVTADAKHAQSVAKAQEARAAETHKEAEKYQAELNSAREKIARQELEINILRKDKHSYRELLDTYDTEIKAKGYDKAKDEQIRVLREQLQRLEELVAELQEELESSKAVALSLSNVQMQSQRQAEASNFEEENAYAFSLKSENEALRLANEKLAAEITKLTQELGSYEIRLGKGDYNPATTKILHMTHNPTSLARQKNSELELLREENSTLRNKLFEIKCQLKDGTAAGMEVDPNEEEQDEAVKQESDLSRPSAAVALRIKVLQEENELLKQQAKDNEVANKRLMGIFKEKTREFRETVYQLFGWRVDYTEQRSLKWYTLKSMYAEKDSDELVFQKKPKSDALELMANDFSCTLDVEVQAFLTRCHSIPAFISNITLSLFDKQTFHGFWHR